MFAPAMMSSPPAMPYRAPTYAPRAAVQAQPRPLIRARAPEEPNPARPPLLSLPSPEKLGVAVRPSTNSIDWTAIHTRITELGIVSYHKDSLPDGRARFTCWVPSERPGVTQRIECVAATEFEAVQVGLQQAAKRRQDRP